MSFSAVAQYDFDSRYFTINATSLPAAPKYDKMEAVLNPKEEDTGSFFLDDIPSFEATLSSLRISSSNYWEPVDMRNAIGNPNTYIDTNINITPVKKDNDGLRVSVYSSDGSSRVNNTVYQEFRGLDIIQPCPPFGICPRCAPYKTNRGY